MAATADGTRRKASGLRTEQALYEATAELFAQSGYIGTTLDAIAEKCGIHKSTIFHYVSSKEDLLAEVLDRGLRQYLIRLESIVSNDDASFRVRLEEALRNHLQFVFDQKQELTVFLRERKHLSGDRGLAYLQMAKRYEALFRELLIGGIEEEEFPPGDARLMTLLILGSANWMVEWYRDDGRLSQDKIEDEFVHLLIEKLVGSPGS